MGQCRDCSFYRVAKPPSELLAAAVGSNDSAVLTAVGKIQEDEKELAAQEQSFRAHVQERGQATWGMRPTMSDYCGVEENAGVFHIAQIRHRVDGSCGFSTEPVPPHDCTTCAHRIVPARLSEDIDQEQAFAWMSSGKAAAGGSASMIENLWKQHLESSGNRRANEVRDAYRSKEGLPVEPNYLDYCRHFSGPRRFVLCALQNPYSKCAHWASQSSAPPPVAGIDASPSPGVDVGALFSLSSTPEPEMTTELGCLAGDFVDFAGCILGITLTDRQIAALRRQLVQTFADSASPAIGAVKNAVAAFQSVKNADVRSRHAWREGNQSTYLQQLRASNDALSQVLLTWHADAAQVLASGTPPLTREAAESWVELISFVTTRSGREQGSALPPDIETHIAQLAAGYQRLSAEQRSMISLAPITLYELRRAWPAMSAAQQAVAESQLEKQLGVATAPAPATTAPPTAAAPPRQASPPSPMPPPPTDETPLDRLRREIKEAQLRGEHEKAAKLNLQFQMELQNESVRLEMERTISETFHRVAMNIWK